MTAGGAAAKHSLSVYEAAFVLFKALVGPGLLFLPSGLKNAGVISACCVSILTGVVSTYCKQRLPGQQLLPPLGA